MRAAHACLLAGMLSSAVFGWAAGCAATPDPARVSGEAGAPAPIEDLDPDASPGGSSGLEAGTDNGDPFDPFAEGVTYYSTTIADNTTEAHNQAGGADAGAPLPTDNGDCMSCHDGSNAGVQQLAIGGIIYQSTGVPCAGTCEVLFVDDADPPHRVKVTTAADGTFFVLPTAYGPVSPRTRVGIRRGQQTYRMVSETVDDGNGTLRGCGSSNCHVAGREGLIVLTP